MLSNKKVREPKQREMGKHEFKTLIKSEIAMNFDIYKKDLNSKGKNERILERNK